MPISLPKHLLPLALSLALAGPAVAAEDPVYLDDRSTPEQVVRSFYNAIARSEYARAFGYFGEAAAPTDYDVWSAPLYDVETVQLEIGSPRTDARAAQIFYDLPVRLRLTQWDGMVRVEAGCIGVTFQLPHDAVPPYQPMHISSFRVAAVPDTAALPSCDD